VTADPRATAWCSRCRRNRQVIKIRSQRNLGFETPGVEARSAWVRLVCGHGRIGTLRPSDSIQIITTLGNLAVMREWFPIK